MSFKLDAKKLKEGIHLTRYWEIEFYMACASHLGLLNQKKGPSLMKKSSPAT